MPMYIADGWKDYEDCWIPAAVKSWNAGARSYCAAPTRRSSGPLKTSLSGKAPTRIITAAHTGGGQWEMLSKIPEQWTVCLPRADLPRASDRLQAHRLVPGAGGELGLDERIDPRRTPAGARAEPVRVYRRRNRLACLNAGAEVCHVDAAKGMVQWAKENAQLSGLTDRPARYIVDDALKFVLREQRRGKQYEGILMDPPSYGRGPDGQVWKLENEVYGLVEECAKLLSDQPLFFLINGYTTGLQPAVLRNLIEKTVVRRYGGRAMADEVGLPVREGNIVLPCGASGRWQA